MTPQVTQPRPAVFLSLFAGVYVVLYVAYFAIPDALLRDVVHPALILSPCAAIIDWIAPAETVRVARGSLISPLTSLHVVRGCDGSGLAFLLLAAIAAFPAPMKRKVAGLLAAVAVVVTLNIARIVALYFVSAHRAGWFAPLHNYYIPTALILSCALFFLAWTAHVVAGNRRQ